MLWSSYWYCLISAKFYSHGCSELDLFPARDLQSLELVLVFFVLRQICASAHVSTFLFFPSTQSFPSALLSQTWISHVVFRFPPVVSWLQCCAPCEFAHSFLSSYAVTRLFTLLVIIFHQLLLAQCSWALSHLLIALLRHDASSLLFFILQRFRLSVWRLQSSAIHFFCL